MPIFEFKCSACEEFFEVLVTRSDDAQEIACPKCQSASFERVLSTTNYSMGGGGSGGGATAQTRTCSGGSCTTFEVPGVS